MEILPEVEVWYALPAIRRQLALALKKLGMTQKQIAAKLDIGESAVSQYLSGKRGASELPPEYESEFIEAAQRISEGTKEVMIREIMRLSQHLKDTRAICGIHRQHSDVPDGCDCCFE